MTMTRSFTVTTTLIQQGDNPRLSISFDFTGLGTSTPPFEGILKSLTAQAITQWWSSLSRFQRSALVAQPESLRTSASYQRDLFPPEK